MDRRKRILVNQYEEAVDAALAESASRCNARVFPKVRVADALDIRQSGLSNDEYGYALKAHFDFVVLRDGVAEFAVEFDGPHHDNDADTIHRDTLKNSICTKLGMPLLRVDSGYLRRIGRFSLLGWLTEMWFLKQDFEESQERGDIPYDHFFFPTFILSDTSGPGISIPYDPFLPSRAALAKFQGRIIDYSPEQLSAMDPHGYAVSIVIASLHDGRMLVGVGRCKHIEFPTLFNLAEELAIVDVVEKIEMNQRGDAPSITKKQVQAWRERITQWSVYR